MTLLAALMLGGCMQATLAPTPEASWKTRDRELMSNLPYKQAAIPEEFRRHIVDYSRKEARSTIVVDTDNKFLYYVLPKGQAIRYGVTVGEEGQAWGGIATVGRMEEWPPWRPTAGEQARLGPLPAFVTGGPQNPMGSRFADRLVLETNPAVQACRRMRLSANYLYVHDNAL